MKYLIIFLSLIFITSCDLKPYQDVKTGWTIPELSKDSLCAITDGTSVYLTKSDSIINDSCKFKIFFINYSNTESTEKEPWKKGLFTCYKSERINLARGSYYFDNYVTDTISTDIQIP